MSNRQYEIILYGASGFTGQLVAEYLSIEYPDVRWAIAGRNQQKLETLRLKLGLPELPILIADSHDTEQLADMVRQAQTVVSTVGPYARYGTPLLEACGRSSSHPTACGIALCALLCCALLPQQSPQRQGQAPRHQGPPWPRSVC